MAEKDGKKQLLHLVFGGELKSLGGTEFRDLDELDIVGIYPDYESAQTAWKAKAQASVDNAHMRYFVVHLHRLLEPDVKTGRPQLMTIAADDSDGRSWPSPRKARADGAVKRLLERVRKPLAQSRFAKGAIASVLAQALRFVHLTNPLAKGSGDLASASVRISTRHRRAVARAASAGAVRPSTRAAA